MADSENIAISDTESENRESLFRNGDASSRKPRIAIALSAGYFGFFAHTGFMMAVEELGINYGAISGSSAGAIVAALHASGVPASEIADALTGLRREDFWDSTGVTSLVRALARRGRGWTGWLKGERFEEIIERQLRVKHFEECQKSLYIVAFNLTEGRDETFTSGTIADKVRASCSYPFLISPKYIDKNHYWDGGFLSKVPVEKMIEQEKPDQVIVHYLPTKKEDADFTRRNWSVVAMLETALTSARKEIESHRLKALGENGQKLFWVEPDLPRVDPRNLKAGARAIEKARHHTLEQLSKQLEII
jgi:NTE family protein